MLFERCAYARSSVSLQVCAYARSGVPLRELSPLAGQSSLGVFKRLAQLAHYFAQTGASLASARFVGKRTVLGSVEGSLRETPARATRRGAQERLVTGVGMGVAPLAA